MNSDEELLARARRGEDRAFRELVLRHEQQVRATVTGMLGAIPEAEDVALEVFVRLHQKLHEFRGEAKLSTYLTRIAINLSLNEQKRQRRRRLRFTPLDQEERPKQLIDTSADPGRGDNLDLIRKAVACLEPDQRAVVVLRLIDGYSVRETAEILELPQGTVASRLARAQERLRQLLKDRF